MNSDTQALDGHARNEAAGVTAYQRWLNASALIAAGALTGFAIILWIAANWDQFSNLERFCIVGAVLLASAATAIFLNAARIPASLIGVATIGGLLALVGQTYQTGADPWQLFAAWAALSLPWVTAARHGSVWVLWVLVIFAALPLWVTAHAGPGWPMPSPVILPAWLAAIATSSALSPWSGLERWTGNTNWAFRLATLLTLTLIVGAALPDLFNSGQSNSVVITAFIALGLAIAAFVLLKPFDIALLSASALALDILLIASFIYGLFYNSHSGSNAIGSALMTGLFAAGIVAASAAGILSQARAHGLVGGAGGQGSSVGGRTWPVAILTGIGALIAAIPFLIFFFMTFGLFLQKGPGAYLLGGTGLACLVPLLRSAKPLGFTQQFGVVALTIAMLLLGFGLYRDLGPASASMMMMLISLGLAACLSADWNGGLLGAAAAAFAAMWLLHLGASGPGYGWSLIGTHFGWSVITGTGALALLARSSVAPNHETHVHWQGFDRALSGWLTAALIGVIAGVGQTFLLSASWWAGPGGTAAAPITLHWNTQRGFSAAFALAGCVWLFAHRPALQSATGYAAAAVATALSYVMASLGAPILLFAGAMTAKRQALAAFAAFAALWVLGAFYYWLGWPLLNKAYLMLAAGLVLGAAAWISGLRLPALIADAVSSFGFGRITSVALIVMSVIATSGVVAKTVMEKEATIRTGRTVFLSLGPVDPRSLIEGDYMALRFAGPRGLNPPEPPSSAVSSMLAVATVDGRRVATIQSYTKLPPHLADNEILIELIAKNGQWTIGTDAWFFKEGTAAKYQNARFGEFRIDKAGKAVLVGLANEALQPLR